MRSILALLLCLPAFGSWSLVDHGKAYAPSPTTNYLNTIGSTLFVMIVARYGASTLDYTPTDSRSNPNWTACGGDVVQGSMHLGVWYVKNPIVAANQTFSYTASGYSLIFVSAWSGADTVSPCDQFAGGGAASSPVLAGMVNPSANNELVITAVGYVQTTPSFVCDLWSNADQLLSGASSVTGAWAYETQTTATGRDPMWTVSGGTNLPAVTVTFKSNAVAPPYRVRHGVANSVGN